MIQYERKQTILQLLEQLRTATVKELAGKVFASEASVRRDLEALEREGYVQRVYGGVILSKYKNSVLPLSLRDSAHTAEKDALARRAAALIPDGATILMDASSTVRRICDYLGGRRSLKIITNSLRICSSLVSRDLKIYGTGGALNQQNQAFVGPAAENFVRSISADFLFFSSQGLSAEGEISDASEEETSLRRVMLSRAEQKIFLCDSSKLNRKYLFTLCHREEVQVFCDAPLPWE